MFFIEGIILIKRKLTELEEKFQQLKNMTESFDEKEKTFRSYLLHHFNILKKTANLEIYIKKGNSTKSDFGLKNSMKSFMDGSLWIGMYCMV